MMQKLAVALVVLLGFAARSQAAGPVCQTYTIKSGDSPYSIASTFNILPDDLAVALADQNLDPATLQPGQVIYLYPYYSSCQFVTSAGSDQDCQAYLVQTGDTLNGIASAFNLYVGDLTDANAALSSNGTGLKPGTYIKLPPWKWGCPEPGNQKPCQVYTASAGDSLASIASMFQVTVDELITVNKDQQLDGSSVLKPNQPVKIYPYYDSCPDGGIPAVPPVTKNTACRAYIVQRGDSLASIARMFGLATNDLIGTNPELSDPSLLTPGKEVKLPPYPDSCGQSILVTSDAAVSGSVSSSSIKKGSLSKASTDETAAEAPAMAVHHKMAAAPGPGLMMAAKAPATAPKATGAPAAAPTAAVSTASTSSAPAVGPSAAALLALVAAVLALL